MEKSAEGEEYGEGRSIGDCSERDMESIFRQKKRMGFSEKAQELSEAILPMLVLLKG